MRFITEFEIPKSIDSKLLDYLIPEKKHIREVSMGEEIGKSLGWQSKTLEKLEYHKLEIEAFPMDKWVEFKQKLYELFHKNGLILSGGALEHMLRDLESFGKPSGDAITKHA